MYRSSATIEDVYRLALPSDTELLVGGEYLTRPVSWACSLRPSAPAFPKLEGNEIALIDMEDLRRLDPQMRLERVVSSLRDARISAIAVLGPVSPAAINVAKSGRAPIFQLPQGTQISQVERTVIRLIVDRSGYIAQRAAELQRELNQIALGGGSWTKLAEHIHAFALQPVLLLREDGQPAAAGGFEGLSEAKRQALMAALPNVAALRTWAATRAPLNGGVETAASGGDVGLLPLQGTGSLDYREAVVAPIVTNEVVRGYVLLLRPASQPIPDVTAVEEIAASQGAAAAALEWAKQNAIDVASERMRATFVDELLAAEIADEQAWIQRGISLGYEMARPHVAWLVEAQGTPDWPGPLLRFAEEQGVSTPYSRREEGLLLYWPLDNPKSGRELKTLAFAFAERMAAAQPKSRLVLGLGRPALGPGQWLQSFAQARESWRLGREWKAAPVTYFGDLGLYQLLTALGDNAEARRFFRKTLGRLMAHDEQHNGELVETLEGFFASHGNLSQTANRLHIHRNTLTYRLERISAITQLNLDDPDARFSLQLALKLRPIMR